MILSGSILYNKEYVYLISPGLVLLQPTNGGCTPPRFNSGKVTYMGGTGNISSSLPPGSSISPGDSDNFNPSFNYPINSPFNNKK